MSRVIDDVDLYAQLLNSVARQGDGQGTRRPLTPVQCAHYIRRMMDENSETSGQVAERLGLGRPKGASNIYKKRDTSQVAAFLNLLKVSEKSRELAGWGYEKHPKIPFSLVAQLSSMKPEEQDAIIQSAFNDEGRRVLGKEDVKKIRRWRNDNPDLPIEDCIRGVLRLKPVASTRHLVVADIRANLEKFLADGPDPEGRLLALLERRVEGTFHQATIGRSVVAISMDAVAYKTFRDSQYRRGRSYSDLLDALAVA